MQTKGKDNVSKTSGAIVASILSSEFDLKASEPINSMFGSTIRPIGENSGTNTGRLFLVSDRTSCSILDLKNGSSQAILFSNNSKPRLRSLLSDRESASISYQTTDSTLWSGITTDLAPDSTTVNSYERRSMLADVLACIISGYNKEDDTWYPAFKDHTDVSSPRFFKNVEHHLLPASGLRWLVHKPVASSKNPRVVLCFSKATAGNKKLILHATFDPESRTRSQGVQIEKCTYR